MIIRSISITHCCFHALLLLVGGGVLVVVARLGHFSLLSPLEQEQLCLLQVGGQVTVRSEIKLKQRGTALVSTLRKVSRILLLNKLGLFLPSSDMCK